MVTIHIWQDQNQLLQNLTHKGTWESASKPQKLFTDTLECGKTIQGLSSAADKGNQIWWLTTRTCKTDLWRNSIPQRQTIPKSALLSLKTSAYPFATPFSWTKVWWGTSTLEILSWQSHINWNISLLWWTDLREVAAYQILRFYRREEPHNKTNSKDKSSAQNTRNLRMAKWRRGLSKFLSVRILIAVIVHNLLGQVSWSQESHEWNYMEKKKYRPKEFRKPVSTHSWSSAP